MGVIANIKGPAGGRSVLHGTTQPTNDLGIDGDFYINTQWWQIFGPKGPQVSWPYLNTLQTLLAGNSWLGTNNISFGQVDPTTPGSPMDDSYINTVSGKIWYFSEGNPGSWGNATDLVTALGFPGAPLVIADPNVLGPANSDGVDGAYWLNQNGSYANVFGPRSSADGWPGYGGTPQGTNLQGSNGQTGAAGTDGLDGKSILHGTTDPTSADGASGDFYLNTTTMALFGPKPTGAAGWSTVRTHTWFYPSAPTDGSIMANPGDYWVYSPFGAPPQVITLYGPYANGVWGEGTVITLLGGAVLSGPPREPTDEDGEIGDYWHKWDEDYPNARLWGPKASPVDWDTPGTTLKGADGAAGKTLLSGPSDPFWYTGTDGDFYLNTTTMTIFGPKALVGVWPYVNTFWWELNLPPELPANQTLIFGTVDPTTEGVEQDTYVNTVNQGVWVKSSTAWVSVGNLVAATNKPGHTYIIGPLNQDTPDPSEGTDGQYYLTQVAATPLVFGPRSSVDEWSAGVSLKGSDSPATHILHGPYEPTTQGIDGDYYFDTTTSAFYGPKVGGEWDLRVFALLTVASPALAVSPIGSSWPVLWGQAFADTPDTTSAGVVVAFAGKIGTYTVASSNSGTPRLTMTRDSDSVTSIAYLADMEADSVLALPFTELAIVITIQTTSAITATALAAALYHMYTLEVIRNPLTLFPLPWQDPATITPEQIGQALIDLGLMAAYPPYEP